MQQDRGQRQPSPKPFPCSRTVLLPKLSRTPARHRPASAVPTGLREPSAATPRVRLASSGRCFTGWWPWHAGSSQDPPRASLGSHLGAGQAERAASCPVVPPQHCGLWTAGGCAGDTGASWRCPSLRHIAEGCPRTTKAHQARTQRPPVQRHRVRGGPHAAPAALPPRSQLSSAAALRNQRETRFPTHSDPNQIPPLSSTFRCRLRIRRSSA